MRLRSDLWRRIVERASLFGTHTLQPDGGSIRGPISMDNQTPVQECSEKWGC
jgi:hypothetical protein